MNLQAFESLDSVPIVRYSKSEFEHLRDLSIAINSEMTLKLLTNITEKLKITSPSDILHNESIAIECLSTYVMVLTSEKDSGIVIHIMQSLRVILSVLPRYKYLDFISTLLSTLNKLGLVTDNRVLFERVLLERECVSMLQIQGNGPLLLRSMNGMVQIITYSEETKQVILGEAACDSFTASWLCVLKQVDSNSEKVVVIMLRSLCEIFSKKACTTLRRAALGIIRSAVQYKNVRQCPIVLEIINHQIFGSILKFLQIPSLLTLPIATDVLVTLNCLVGELYDYLGRGLEAYICFLVQCVISTAGKYEEHVKNTSNTTEVFGMLMQCLVDFCAIPNIACWCFYNFDLMPSRLSVLTLLISSFELIVEIPKLNSAKQLLAMMLQLLSFNSIEGVNDSEELKIPEKLKLKQKVEKIAEKSNGSIEKAMKQYEEEGYGVCPSVVDLLRNINGINKTVLTSYLLKRMKDNPSELKEVIGLVEMEGKSLMEAFWLFTEQIQLPEAVSEKQAFIRVFSELYLEKNKQEESLETIDGLVFLMRTACVTNYCIFTESVCYLLELYV
ncbi:hypothetical protein EIN_229340 [Entamoeba invadens IP1]|uniref:SEC7 domain-containing protein n=1 Tax=Entamoeba invadens IP1 TaxID=370355 RepID=A0A0A1U2X0_ENTIV|nr:hypothetical protein EIN_229340 [Entamoeba invadens IP1]ELP88411.1 hypothetical protein EIN_229340 [Entamoeba invadens IP1]|eukprot:XP_004255182.1 hypothetical protein EIN_229340 [Entamoeba invadens IP1]